MIRLRTSTRAIALLLPGLLLLAAGVAEAAPVSAVDFTGQGSLRINGAYTLGYEFVALSSIQVTDLGYFDAFQDGLNADHYVGLWTNGGALLASATVTTASILDGWFRYESITPVTLVAGQTYVVGGYHPGDFWANGVVGLTIAPQITFVRPRYVSGLGFPALSDAGTTGNFGGSFRYDGDALGPNSVPLPSAAWAGMGLLAVLGVARRRKRRGVAQARSSRQFRNSAD